MKFKRTNDTELSHSEQLHCLLSNVLDIAAAVAEGRTRAFAPSERVHTMMLSGCGRAEQRHDKRRRAQRHHCTALNKPQDSLSCLQLSQAAAAVPVGGSTKCGRLLALATVASSTP